MAAQDDFLQLFNARIDQLRAKNETINPAIGRIREKNGQLAGVIGQIHDAVAALTAQVNELDNRIRAAQQEREDLRRRIAELEARPDQQAQAQQLQQRVDQLTRAITDANDVIGGIVDSIDNLIRAADEEGITPEQVAAITADIAAIGDQTRRLSLMLPAGDQIPPPANQGANDGEGRAGGGKKAKRAKRTRKTRKIRRTKGRRQRGGYNWISSSASARSRTRSTSSSSRTRSTKRRNKKTRSSL